MSENCDIVKKEYYYEYATCSFFIAVGYCYRFELYGLLSFLYETLILNLQHYEYDLVSNRIVKTLNGEILIIVEYAIRSYYWML